MPRKKAGQAYTWKDLEGKIAPEILCAPRTGGDPSGEWQEVHPRVIGYIVRNILEKPWADHLTLIAAVLFAQRRDVWTVEHAIGTLNARFWALYSLFKLDDMHQWTIDQHLVPYMRGEVLPQDPLTTRVSFFRRYMALS